ncbi:MAG: HEAT repeat domain-containing protein [Thermodesulfobacteriota bacterium]|nr:HEAT repeat domain-containing protein [Thermodesulfobacteriota bacterium]
MKDAVLEQILEDLKDNDPNIKQLAAKALLQQPGVEKIISEILDHSDHPTSSIIYEQIYEAQGDYSSIFRTAMDNSDPRIRGIAVRYLFRKGSFEKADGIQWLKDPDPYVRRRVLGYLAWVGDCTSLEEVIPLASRDTNPLVRRDALKLIAIWGKKTDTGTVLPLLEDSDHRVRTQAILTLRRITGEDFGEPMGSSGDEQEWIAAKWQGWWEIIKEEG